MKILLFLVTFILSSSFVAAGGEVSIINDHTLRVEIDDQIRSINDSPIVYDQETGTTPIQIWESDDEVAIEVYAQNNKFHRITIVDAVQRNKKYPVYLCMNYPLHNYLWNQENSSFCENYEYSFRLRDLKRGQSQQFEIPPIINGSNPWSIWVGNGAGGGGGLPLCEGIVANMNLNQTQTQNGSKFRMGGMGQFYGSTSAGCSINNIYWQQYNDAPLWRTIPTSKSTDTNIDCDGVLCYRSSSSLNTWYYKYPKCNDGGNRTLRVQIRYTHLSNIKFSNSVTQVMECLLPEVEEEETPFHHAPDQDRDKSIYFLPFAFALTAGFIILKTDRGTE